MLWGAASSVPEETCADAQQPGSPEKSGARPK